MSTAIVSQPSAAAAATTTTTTANDPSYIPRGPVEASIAFWHPPPDGSKPFYYVENPPPGQPQSNLIEVPQKVSITDIRGHEANFSLDRDAFQALQNVPPTKADPSFTDDANIKSVYYPEVEDLILTHVPGATRVVIFDHTIRRSNPDAPRGPVTRAHVDQTPYSAAERVKYHLPADEAEQLLRGRYRIINVWRPLNGPVQDMPLAFASSLSVDDADLVPVEHRYPDRTGETATVLYAPTQKWYYWSGIGGDERLLLKCSDSKEGAPGKRVPHTAFVDPRTPVGARGRESIEVRCLVFG
ncbi:methyltransferase [Coccidioides immitis RS]|uniref:Methyltransferase n=2 Tax=Coccidioides immitis TaxID=5501 RepID=A0A0E1RXQ5_COCIM|nr:methyltransferase [Coccidioides immitis RS]EAS32449.1 methyltransferase [Coccidioides immitis RS]KMP07687.1 7alpha-cephem-methoxylase P8 chain [Coccidioides immitis RMSCC 2394]TPX19576.1 hypothetical protein DIZ76_017368 [Coccidioides immitis]